MSYSKNTEETLNLTIKLDLSIREEDGWGGRPRYGVQARFKGELIAEVSTSAGFTSKTKMLAELRKRLK
jgi:hypothetical protein